MPSRHTRRRGPLELGKILLSEKQIQDRVAELGARISEDYADEPPIFVNVLKGGVIFLADLIRATKIPIEIDFMEVSSYGDGTESTGVVRILEDLSQNIEGRHVLIIEDIIDTGHSLAFAKDYLGGRGAASVHTCVLLDKPGRREAALRADFVGFEIENRFVVGYGLDFAEHYRDLPYVGVLDEEADPQEKTQAESSSKRSTSTRRSP